MFENKNFLESGENKEEENSKFELENTQEGREIKEFLEKEFTRREIILKNTLEELDIPDEEFMLAPPLLTRTDFGYNSDIDGVFLGSMADELRLEQKLMETHGLSLFVINLDEKDLENISENIPELYGVIERNRGITAHDEEIEPNDGEEFFEKAPEKEARLRSILSPEQKEQLKQERLRIGEEFMEEINQKAQVLGYRFFGSMMSDMDRFGINSDVDLDVLLEVEDKKKEREIFLYVRMYLKWKYIEQYGVEVDCHHITSNKLRELVQRSPELKQVYEEKFNIDI